MKHILIDINYINIILLKKLNIIHVIVFIIIIKYVDKINVRQNNASNYYASYY